MSQNVVVQIHRYPVKSLQGESLRETRVAKRGLPGDRVWAVRDEVNGGIRGGKKIGGLMELAAALESEPTAEGSTPATVTFQDGSTGSTSDADLAARISAAVGHEVTLWPLVPADQLDHYRRGAPTHADPETEIRSVLGREPDEPLPDLSKFPPEALEFESPPGTYFDAFPLLVMTRASLDTMQARGNSRFDVRRFRPNLLIDGAEGDFPENDWVGRTLRVGDAELQVEMTCPRCVMATRGFADLPQDPKVMRSLVKENGGDLGVYASVRTEGTVRVGDRVEIV